MGDVGDSSDLEIHSAGVEALKFLCGAVTVFSQEVHDEGIVYALERRKNAVSTKFDVQLVSAQEVANGHDPACLNVVDGNEW